MHCILKMFIKFNLNLNSFFSWSLESYRNYCFFLPTLKNSIIYDFIAFKQWIIAISKDYLLQLVEFIIIDLLNLSFNY